MNMRRRNKGFTIIELMVSIGIFAMLVSISVAAFAAFERNEALEASVSAVASGLRDARTRTMASINDSQYGVRVVEDRITLFQNSSSNGAPISEVFMLNSRIKATTSVSEFLFSRISGNSSASGTIDLYIVSDPTKRKTITVQSTGLISTQ